MTSVKWISEVFKNHFGEQFLPHFAPKLVVMDNTNACPFLVDMT
jgi:hypothetical protein